MVTSNYMPDITVEIAFDSGFGTADADRTWTDVSDYVELAEGITITVGRQDERSTADANQLTLTLDNSDGRFTPGYSSGAYYPNVKLDRPIRVKIDPVDGSEVTAFVGYINEWPLEWAETGACAKATITASSRLSRLGMQRQLRDIITETLRDPRLTAAPVAHYTLGEPEGATQANDSSGAQGPPLILAGDSSNPVVFGSATGPGTDGLTAAQFAGGQYLTRPLTTTSASLTFEVFCSAEAEGVLFSLQGGTTPLVVRLDSFGQANANYGGGSINGSTDLRDGETHHVAVTVSGTTWTLYVDGSSVDSDTLASFPTGTYTLLLGSADLPDVGGGGPSYVPLTGVLAHWAMFNQTLTTEILQHANAGLTGHAGEGTDDRLERYAGIAHIPSAEVSAETGSTTVAHVDTTDKTPADLMRVVETTEGGVLFDAPDGTLTLHNRSHRYKATSSWTLDMSEDEVEAEYVPRLDRTALLNDVTASNIDGTVAEHVTDEDSIDDYGVATSSVETASEDDGEPLNLASWLVYKYAEPKERTPTLTVNVLAQVGKTPGSDDILATEIGDKITVDNRPDQAATSSVDYFVEGWTLNAAHESLFVTFNVSPSSPDDEVLIVGDASRGEIGVNPIAF